MRTDGGAPPAFMSAVGWHDTLAAPTWSSDCDSHARARITRFTGIPPEIIQPALKDTVICLHLGGPKRVHRWQAGRKSVQDVELGSLTFLPARQENRWWIEGGTDFAHLTLTPGFLNQIASEEFDREPSACEIMDRVGVKHGFVEQLFRALIVALEGGTLEGRLYPESLLVVLTTALVREHSRLSDRVGGGAVHRRAAKGGLASWQLRRVVDHMAHFIDRDIGLDDLTELTGLSRAHFFRAFKQSTGLSPHRFLTKMRIDQACILLQTSERSVDEVSAAMGFAKAALFAATFKRQVGLQPRLYKASRTYHLGSKHQRPRPAPIEIGHRITPA